MSIWDVVVVVLIIGMGVALWRQHDSANWLEWLVKWLMLSALLFGPYFFWEEIGAYWESSSDGPVDLQQEWF